MRKDYNALNRTQHFIKAIGEERKQLEKDLAEVGATKITSSGFLD